eukprot:6207120-Pleurochrysis_carterae.AAC.2
MQQGRHSISFLVSNHDLKSGREPQPGVNFMKQGETDRSQRRCDKLKVRGWRFVTRGHKLSKAACGLASIAA